MIRGDINKSKACMLIALDVLFSGYYEGKEWLEDLYLEYFNDIGFNGSHWYLLEEAAPVFVLPNGAYTHIYCQGDLYLQTINTNTNIRYRVPYNQDLILIYAVDESRSHALCIKAETVLAFGDRFTISGMIFKKQGLIVDKVK